MNKEDVVLLSYTKKNEILYFEIRWMDLECIMLSEIMDLEGIVLSEISQTEKDKHCMFSLICRI